MAFNGQRLKIARVYRNMSATELAELIDVKKQAISQFENGAIRPKPETEFAIITTLGFPREFFHQEIYETKKLGTFFRALSSANALDKKTQETKTEMVVKIYEFLCDYLNLPCLNLPNIDVEGKNIEDIALLLRDYWEIDEKPVPNMVNLLENNGIIVSAFDMDSKKIDAFTQMFSFENGLRYCVVVGNDKKSAVRRNFDMAHELGHIILHSNVENLDELTKEEEKKMENEADQFAAAFLLPKNAFYNDLKNPTDLKSYVELKQKWHVSISAMLIRAKALGRITIKQYQALMKSMSYRKWRTCEPLDEQMKIPVPTLFISAFEVLFENDIMTHKSFINKLSAYGLPMAADEIEKLLALPKNTLNVVCNNIVNFSPIIKVK